MRISVKTAAAAACGIAAALLVSGCSVFSDPEGTTKYSYFEPDKTTVTTLPPETTEPTTTEATTADDEAVVAAVEGELASLLDESSVEVVCGGKSVIIPASRVNAPADPERLAARLSERGCAPDTLERYLALKGALPQGKTDRSAIRAELAAFQKMLESAAASTYEIDGRVLTLHVGEKTQELKIYGTAAKVAEAFDGFAYGKVEADYTEKNPELPWDEIAAACSVEAVDAHYEYVDLNENARLVPETDGYALDMEQIQNRYAHAKEGATLTFTARDTHPTLRADNVDEMLFSYEISSYKTWFNVNEWSRSENIRLASRNIDGAVIMPGERFSFNGTVGERTKERGFQEATVYVQGTMEPGLGGGICQVSSTIYCAALRGGFTQVYRYNHQFTISYTALGEDATVYWGALDYSFRNNYDFPVKILMEIDGGFLNVRIMGQEPENKFTVVIEHETEKELKQKMVYEEKKDMKPGTEKLQRKGKPGYIIITKVTVYQNGTVYSRWEYKDTYDPYNGLTYRGPKITSESTTEETTTEPPETTRKTKKTTEPTETTEPPESTEETTKKTKKTTEATEPSSDPPASGETDPPAES